jgi:hypothetical protein
MNDFPFHVTWVVGRQVQITTYMGRFPVHFRDQCRTPPHDQEVQELRSIISFNFHCVFHGRSNGLEVKKKLEQSCWTMWPTHESVVDISEPFSRFMVICNQCYFLSVSQIYYWPPEIVSFALPYSLFADRIYSQTGSTYFLNRCPVIPLHLVFVKVNALGRKDSYWVYFLSPVRLLSLVRWWVDWQLQNLQDSLLFFKADCLY